MKIIMGRDIIVLQNNIALKMVYDKKQTETLNVAY